MASPTQDEAPVVFSSGASDERSTEGLEPSPAPTSPQPQALAAKHAGVAASANPPVRGERLFTWLAWPFLRLDDLVERLVPAQRNPFAHTGAIATTTFVIAAITGILTLLWYSPSVFKAYESVEAMTAATLTGGLVRSLHRYSSDACMLFALVHAVKLFTAKRFTGPRWSAWVTGILVIGIIWFIGWLGYWLIWDERARQVALGSAVMLDKLSIFAEPLSRSFLTDASINSLLFFMVFFFHMLVPLVAAFVLWLHIVRLSRPRFLADRTMTYWILGALVVASLVWPATSAGEARMAENPAAFTMDWWYLAPLVLTERLGGGLLWLIALVSGLLIGSIPWSLRRRQKTGAVEAKKMRGPDGLAAIVPPFAERRPEAVVKNDSCNACRLCYEDCPYNAIQLVPRPPGGKRDEPLVARVDPSRCVGCGICTGSCNSAGIELTWLLSLEQRRRQDLRLEEGPSAVAFVCAESAGASLVIDEAGRSDQLPGYRIEAVPCAGWVHALTIERAFRHGAKGVLIAGCGDGNCTWREGVEHTSARIRGERRPIVRPDKVDADRVHLVPVNRGDLRGLQRAAERLLAGAPSPRPRVRGLRGILGGVVVATATAAVMVVLSDLPVALPPAEPALVISFNHPGERGEHCRDRSPEELAKLPVHMRQVRICERGRASVRLRVTVDGVPRLEKTFEPGGLSGDGNSVAMETIPLSVGQRRVQVELGDTLDPSRYNHVDERTVELTPRARRVILFDKRTGFGWH